LSAITSMLSSCGWSGVRPCLSIAASFDQAARKSASFRADDAGGALRASSSSCATRRRVSALISSRAPHRSLPVGISVAEI